MKRRYTRIFDRLIENPELYKDWRKRVIVRDGHACQWPGCNKKTRLNVHHIKPWALFPLLRYNVDNGITLCYFHHKGIKDKEEYFAHIFFQIINDNKNGNNRKNNGS